MLLPFPVALYCSSLMAVYNLMDHRGACIIRNEEDEEKKMKH